MTVFYKNLGGLWPLCPSLATPMAVFGMSLQNTCFGYVRRCRLIDSLALRLSVFRSFCTI